MLRDSLAEERRAALRHIAVEAALFPLVRHTLVKGLQNCGTEGQRDVSDAHAIQRRPGVSFQICLNFLGDVIKQVGILQLLIMKIQGDHNSTSPS